MRVIGGEARGRRLRGPAGPGTRPMADKIREALFSVLASLGMTPERTLDLYSGTGAIGIEALSRGAGWCDFVEREAAACAVIRHNIELVGYSERARVIQADAMRFIREATQSYDLIILDPPYADPDILATLDSLSHSMAVTDGTIVALGHWPKFSAPERIGRLSTIRARCHGDSCFSVFDVVFDSASEVRGTPDVIR